MRPEVGRQGECWCPCRSSHKQEKEKSTSLGRTHRALTSQAHRGDIAGSAPDHRKRIVAGEL